MLRVEVHPEHACQTPESSTNFQSSGSCPTRRGRRSCAASSRVVSVRRRDRGGRRSRPMRSTSSSPGRARVVKADRQRRRDPAQRPARRRQLRRGRAARRPAASRRRSAPASDVLALRLDGPAFRGSGRRPPLTSAPISSCSSNTPRCRGSSATSPPSPGCPPEAMAGIVLAELEPTWSAAGETSSYRQGDPPGRCT